MFNLTPVYLDAIRAAKDHGRLCSVAALPATVYMLQRDVVNQYRYMLDHYLVVPLDAPFLQNSSLGSPYEKWAHFLNEDAEQFSTAAHSLLRFTSRFVHETTVRAHEAAQRYSEMKTAGNNYIGALVEISKKSRHIGLRINDDETLDVTPFSARPRYDGKLVMHSTANGERQNLLTTSDEAGTESTSEISDAHAAELLVTLKSVTNSVRDRSFLDTLYERGTAEADELESLNDQFAVECRNADWRANPFTTFDSLHPSWCG